MHVWITYVQFFRTLKGRVSVRYRLLRPLLALSGAADRMQIVLLSDGAILNIETDPKSCSPNRLIPAVYDSEVVNVFAVDLIEWSERVNAAYD